MIRSYADKRTAALFLGDAVHGVAHDLQRRIRAKLLAIDSAVQLQDLSRPPGNRLEALSGGRRGQHSIRVNDQWRICFRWDSGHAFDVEFGLP